ncbi:MAG: MoxR family ATPase [Candidatus Binataceae bacterium]|jgi:MoxR-like ATPase
MSENDSAAMQAFSSVEAVQEAFARENFIADRPLALTVMLAARLEKPILLEGEAGVGKTEVAKVVARVLGTELVRLQCYEGLDAQSTIYEWNYAKQILAIRMAENAPQERADLERSIFSDEFLLPRPLLQAIRDRGGRPVTLLIDEIDRADEEFEAFLLEVLSDYQVTVPEIGTFTAKHRPFVVLTSNRTRELNDALKRRCLYLWIDYPTRAKEREIVMRKVPGIEEALADQIAGLMHTLREVDFYKRPGVAETLDWARALVSLKILEIDPATLEETAGCILKYKDDIERLRSIGTAKVLSGSAGTNAANVRP